MFSDRHRRWKLVGALGLLVGLSTWHAWRSARVPVGWRYCLEAPAERDGAGLIFSLYAVQSVEGPEAMTISKLVRDVPVVGLPTGGLAPGDTVSVTGTFDASGPRVQGTRVEQHPLRPVKRGLGVLGMLLFLVLAPRTFTWRDGRLRRRG